MTDPIIETSIQLRSLPFRPVIECNDNTVTVTLRPMYGGEVKSTAVSFALAWAGAMNRMKGAALVRHVDEAEQADYDATIADFEAGYGRR
jgi:hypothetical protein